MWRWTDAHFCSLPSQTTIYGCTSICVNGTNKLLVASLLGKFFTMEYLRIFDKLTPSTKEVQFAYIPGESEIVSVDSAGQCCHGNKLTIGVTFLKLEDNENKPLLHIYSASQKGEEFNLESEAQGMELQFVPYHLTHTDLRVQDGTEAVFLLSGGDSKIHMYRETSEQHSFTEADCEEQFPELKDLPSVVMWLDIYTYNNNSHRLTVSGHQDGCLTVSIVNVDTLTVLKSYRVDFDSPVTYVKVFSLHNSCTKPSFLPGGSGEKVSAEPAVPELNILVLSALIPATVYRDVLRCGLQEIVMLPDSNMYDAILTGCIIDIDFDGENEILIGTYGQEVLAYKLDSLSMSSDCLGCHSNESLDQDTSLEGSKCRHQSVEGELSIPSRLELKSSRRVKSQENLSSSVSSDADYIPLSSSKDTVVLNSMYQSPKHQPPSTDSCRLLWQRSFPCPVMGIHRLDIMGDGMEDLVVVTLKGLHILQPDLSEVATVCLERLRTLAGDTTLKEHEQSQQVHEDNIIKLSGDTERIHLMEQNESIAT